MAERPVVRTYGKKKKKRHGDAPLRSALWDRVSRPAAASSCPPPPAAVEAPVTKRKPLQDKSRNQSLQAEVAAAAAKGKAATRAASPSVRVACSRLRARDKARLGEQLEALAGDSDGRFAPTLVTDGTAATATHLVVPDEGAQRTLKAIHAVLRGAWIVRLEWVARCAAAGDAVDPTPFEASESLPGCAQARRWRAAGELGRRFFHGLRVHVQDGAEPGRAELEQIMRLGNAQVVATARDADLVIVGPHAHERGLCTRDGRWVLEQVEHGRLARAELAREKVCQDPSIVARVLGFLAPEGAAAGSSVCHVWSAAAEMARNQRSAAAVRVVCEALEARRREHETLVTEAEIGLVRELGECLRGPGEMKARFPRGRFLAGGAYKRVFAVWNAAAQREEAISVMDYEAICRNASLGVVSREVEVSLRVSELAASGACENLMRTFGTFQALEGPPRALWGGEGDVDDGEVEPGLFQYIRMELCELGDLEEHQKQLPEGELGLESVRAALFQMCSALAVARHELGLRHMDVKLLNFFLQRAPADGKTRSFPRQGQKPFEDRSDSAERLAVKLADFGTADLQGGKVTVDHFTTLENTAPELLFEGDAAEVDASDAFALGLCFVHLLTGQRPYEETLAEAQCPAALRNGLRAAWKRDGYAVIRQVLEDDADDLLYHTLYRYAVLLGLDALLEAYPAEGNAVGAALGAALGPGGRGRECRKAREQFEADRARFALHGGEDEALQRLAARLEALGPPARDLLDGLLAAAPGARRTDLGAVLCGPVFEQND